MGYEAVRPRCFKKLVQLLADRI